MNNAPGPFTPPSGSDERDRQRAAGDTLREALRTLASSGPGGAAPSTLSPEVLADLAQRAGLPGGADDLSRLLGRDIGGVADAPIGPQYVVFVVGGVECCVRAENVQAIERITDLAPVPNTAPWALGVVQLRGSIVSVVDLSAFLGLGATASTGRTRLLVVTYRGMTIGFTVDAVLEMRADSTGMRSVSGYEPPEWMASYASDVLQLGDRRIVLVDVQRLLYADRMHQYHSETD